MTQSTVMAYFIIYCDTISPQEITQQLNIDPTEVCIKGEVSTNNTRPSRFTSWRISTEYEFSYDINDQLSKIISQLIDKKEQLKQISLQSELLCFEVVIRIENNEVPATYFAADTLKFMADIGSNIDIDQYVFSAESEVEG